MQPANTTCAAVNNELPEMQSESPSSPVSLRNVMSVYREVFGHLITIVSSVKGILDFDVIVSHAENFLDDILPPVNENEAIKHLPKNIARWERCYRLASTLCNRVKIHGGLWLALSKAYVNNRECSPITAVSHYAASSFNRMIGMVQDTIQFAILNAKDALNFRAAATLCPRVVESIPRIRLFFSESVEQVQKCISDPEMELVSLASLTNGRLNPIDAVSRICGLMWSMVPHGVTGVLERMMAESTWPSMVAKRPSQHDALSTSSTESGCTTGDVTPGNCDEHIGKDH